MVEKPALRGIRGVARLGQAAVVIGVVGAIATATQVVDGPGELAQGSGGSSARPELIATEDAQGSFDVPCEYSHSGPDDPIVHQGHAGMSHLHEFFGATNTDANSDAESLLASETTCRTVADHAAYWAPALLVDGEPLHPTHIVAYYRVPLGADAQGIQAPPNGLEMIAGNAHATEPQDPGIVHWSCGPLGEPSPVPVSCRAGIEPTLRLTFNPCWDGENLGSEDHYSHLAPLGGDGDCPSSHPVLIPELMMEVRYPYHGESQEGELSLASGPITGSHGDALMAWEPDVLQSKIDTCLVHNRNCDVVSERSRLTLGLG